MVLSCIETQHLIFDSESNFTFPGSLEKAARYGIAEREVEKARLLWHRGDTNHARTCLGRIVNSHYDRLDFSELKKLPRSAQIAHAEVRLLMIDSTSETRIYPMSMSMVRVKVYLLHALYDEENCKFEKAEVMKHYKKAIDICPGWEDCYFKLAVYYDKYLVSRSDNVPLYWKVYKQATQNYGRGRSISTISPDRAAIALVYVYVT